MSCRCIALALFISLTFSSGQAAIADSLAFEDFDAIHKLIRPAGGESRWLEIDWHTDFWKARQVAAAKGKPILLWSGGGALPLGGC